MSDLLRRRVVRLYGRCCYWFFVRVLEGHSSSVRSISFSPDSQFICSMRTRLSAFGRSFVERVFVRWRGHRDAVLSACWSPDGNKIVSGSYDKTIKI